MKERSEYENSAPKGTAEWGAIGVQNLKVSAPSRELRGEEGEPISSGGLFILSQLF
jgi:hypothetical protein